MRYRYLLLVFNVTIVTSQLNPQRDADDTKFILFPKELRTD